MDIKNEKISLYKILKRIIPMVFLASPIYFIFFNIVSIVNGILAVMSTIMTQKFFDSVTNAVNNGETVSNVLLIGGGLGLVLIIDEIGNGVLNFIPDDLSYRVNAYIGGKINKKVGSLDPLVFENPSTLDDINRANVGMMDSMFLVFIFSMIFTSYVPYFLMMAAYLYRLKPVLSLSIIIIFIPVALNQFIRLKVFRKLSDEAAPVRREVKYYEDCIVDREYFKETRQLGAFKYFIDLYVSSIKLLNKKRWAAEKESGIMELKMKGITLLGYMGVLYLLVDALIKGEISVGAFGAVFASIGQMFSTMEEIISRHIGRITEDLGNINHLIRFLDIPEREGSDFEIKGVPGITLRNVSFRYPGREEETLNTINLDIKPGETIAIVGENGAGKTTLVKIMTGIYIPNDGQVIFGGIDTSKISMKSLYKNISAVFQKFQRYKMNLGENIAISDLVQVNDEKLNHATKKADLIIDKEKFKDSYGTMLSREFDGIDLSGGQWQKIAIARGFYKVHDTIVLDEPTAAIDPIEETKIYNKFADMSKDKTAIIVTHRLGAAKIADRIVVMDKGEICEIGTHEELINIKGKYSEMYNAQSKWYVET
ncbi:ABC transporter ATP-binding protein [Clostridium hydrogeniformans]|uniref:ABC transporter ATP-binding protein n=1 Tax=Clostridium hydrogeniformans TaxID=349933 RepID=UPI000554A788|nr:ABC transporter ATP-binding protein [Clostridium hydrogeniformans]